MSTIFHSFLKPLKTFLPQSLWHPMRALGTAVVTPFRFGIETGHFSSSLAMEAKSKSGAPLPWYTYPAIDLLSLRAFADRNVLEFGGGQSTLWWAGRAKSVSTIEENFDWYSKIKNKMPSNVSLHHVPADTVGRKIAPVIDVISKLAIKKFDVVIIDGHLRAELVPIAFDLLTDDGAVIFDNAEGYDCYQVTRGSGAMRVDFYGFAPGVSLRHCTSIFFKPGCFLFDSNIPIVSGEQTGA